MDLKWPKVIALLFAASFTLIVAVRLNIEQMHLMAGTLVSIPVVAVVTGWFSLRRISADRSAPTVCTEGVPFTVTLTAAGTDWSSRAVLSLRDSVPEWIEVESTSTQAASGLTVVYRAVARRRGVYALGPARIEASDPLGISTFHRQFGWRHELMVYPAPYLPPGAASVVADLLTRSAETSRRLKGDSADFDSTREYRDGDEPRWIHWPSTARRGHLVVVERSREMDVSLLIAIDLRSGTEEGSPPNTTVDAAARLSAYVAREALTCGVKVGILAVGGEDFSLPPANSGTQYPAILESLARMTASCPSPFANVLVDRLHDLWSGGPFSLLFVTSSPDSAVLEVLSPLVDRGVTCCGFLMDGWARGSAGVSPQASAFAKDASAVGIKVATLPPFTHQP
ncbi:MAG: DUF58 domain-containing protein [Armatimonadota bacterium]